MSLQCNSNRSVPACFCPMVQHLRARRMLCVITVLSVTALTFYTVILTTFPAHIYIQPYASGHGDSKQATRLKQPSWNSTQVETLSNNSNIEGLQVETRRHSVSNAITDQMQEKSFQSFTQEDFKTIISTDLYLSSDDLFQNISTTNLGNRSLFFNAIPEEEYLKENISYFKGHKEPVNNFNHSFLIQGENVCQRQSPFILFVIPSVVSHSDRRDAIRRTWLRAAESNSWPRVDLKHKVKHVFVFGYRKHSLTDDLEDLLQESHLNNDIVMLNFLDTYRNLTIKILSAMRWKQQFCSQAEYLLKVDEDTFVNVPLMIELLKYVAGSLKDAEGFVLGHRHSKNKPSVVRTKGSRWEVSKTQYPLSHYPRYLLGHSYAVSRAAVPKILAVSKYLNLIPPEDAFITGIAAKSSGVARLTATGFSRCCTGYSSCDIVWNKKVTVTATLYPNDIEELWTHVAKQYCNDSS